MLIKNPNLVSATEQNQLKSQLLGTLSVLKYGNCKLSKGYM